MRLPDGADSAQEKRQKITAIILILRPRSGSAWGNPPAGKGIRVLEQANIDIGKAMAVEARRHTDEVRTNELISAIDELLWELEGLNLQDRRVVPDELVPRITMVVAEATESAPPAADEIREPLAALDRLFEAQGRLTKLKCERQGFEVLDWDETDELLPAPWMGRRRPR